MLVFLSGAVKCFYSRKFGINLFSEITPSYLDYSIFIFFTFPAERNLNQVERLYLENCGSIK